MADDKKHAPKDDDSPETVKPHSDIEMPELQRVEGAYGALQIQALSDLEHVRQRSGMYIGNTESSGLHQLVYEAVDNSIDEAMAGHAHEVSVIINVDGSINVADDGRGIPVETHPDLG